MGEELIEPNEEILYNKANMQNMAQMLRRSDNRNILVCVQAALEEAKEAENNSCIKIISLCKKLEFLPMGLWAGSITGGQTPHPED
jgi:hypothetical protein